MSDPRDRRDDDVAVSRALVKLILASVLLSGLILTAYVTSTPTRSPIEGWKRAAYAAWWRVFPLDPDADRAELVGLHADASSIPTPECISCHGTMVDSPVAFHRIHLENELLPGLACNDCHARVDLAPRGNERIVEWVDVGICKDCHSPFPGSTEPTAVMSPMDFEIDCTMCHTGSHAFRHESPYLSHVIAPSECKGCHGGRVLPWSEAHERDDWLAVHGAEALRTGDEECFRCHDFGLKFCDTCHAEKPPSHLPPDRWKAHHPDAARADTRACRTCHELDFCKRCHLSHEEGWLERHSEFVLERGQGRCPQCHSTSFCSFCHTAEPSSAEDSGSPTP